MSRIPPEYLGPEPLDRSVAADVLVREEPDEEEEDEEENEQDKDKEEDDDDGYSEWAHPPFHFLAGTWATKRQVVLKPRVAFLVHPPNGFDIGKGGAICTHTVVTGSRAPLNRTRPPTRCRSGFLHRYGNSEPRIRLFGERPMTRTESGTFSFFGYAHRYVGWSGAPQ